MVLAFISSLGITGHAYADDYGCRVLMCLSNPNGPMSERECEPPIRKFLEGQAKDPKDPFPSCPEGAPATMGQAYRPYDECPDGTTTLGLNSRAIQMTPESYKQLVSVQRPAFGPFTDPQDVPKETTYYVGIGDGNNNLDAYAKGSAKVCVGKVLGILTFRGEGSDSTPYSVTAYDQVASLAPALSPLVYDVKIDGKLYRSVRF